MKEHECEVCGKKVFHKSKINGKTLCPKHLRQYKRHKSFMDTCPNTINDLNLYHTLGSTTTGIIYDNTGNIPIAKFLVDTRDLSKIRYHRWRLSFGRIVTGKASKGTKREIGWTILGLDSRDYRHYVITYRNGDWRDNRRKNLRLTHKTLRQ